MNISILFNNINQGLIFRGYEQGPVPKKILEAPDVQCHLNAFSKLPDVDFAVFTEVLFEDRLGQSIMRERLSEVLQLPYSSSQVTGPCFDRLKEIDGKYYGQVTLSRYPIISEERKEIREPDFLDTNTFKYEVIDNSRQEPHRKYVQKTIVEVDGESLSMFNVHSIPFHLFKKDGKPLSLEMPEFREWLCDFSKLFDIAPKERFVICGDLNNPSIPVNKLLENLFNRHHMNNCVSFLNAPLENVFKRNATQGDYTKRQVDYILSSDGSVVLSSRALITPSDHPALYTKLQF